MHLKLCNLSKSKKEKGETLQWKSFFIDRFTMGMEFMDGIEGFADFSNFLCLNFEIENFEPF